jgi:Zn-dependent alcohol dehydrogenase
MRAALLHAVDDPLDVVDDLDVAEPRAGQVRVRVSYCGICHSDLLSMEGLLASPLPVILGHEAAGEVDAVGEGVTNVVVGDKVVITPMPSCGRCRNCVRGHPTLCVEARTWMTGLFPDGTSPFSWRGRLVYRGNGLGGWGELTVTPATGVVKVSDDTPLDIACLIGCAVQTGVGAVLNTAKVERGSSVLVMGLGGIGQSIVQGARIAGATQIIVSDPVASRRAAAMEVGATDEIDPSEVDVARTVRALSDGRAGVDYAFDAAGSAELITTGVKATAPGGTIVMVGAAKATETLAHVAPSGLIGQEKRLLGSMVGTCYAPRDFPMLLGLWKRGALDLERMVSFRRPLSEVNAGVDDLRAGRGIRTVLHMEE